MKLTTIIRREIFICAVCKKELESNDSECLHPDVTGDLSDMRMYGIADKYPNQITILFDDGTPKIYSMLSYNVSQ